MKITQLRCTIAIFWQNKDATLSCSGTYAEHLVGQISRILLRQGHWQKHRQEKQKLVFFRRALHVGQYVMICNRIVNELPACLTAFISIATASCCKAVAMVEGGGKENEH